MSFKEEMEIVFNDKYNNEEFFNTIQQNMQIKLSSSMEELRNKTRNYSSGQIPTKEEFESEDRDLVYHAQLPENYAAKELVMEWNNMGNGFTLYFNNTEQTKEYVSYDFGHVDGNIYDELGIYSIRSTSQDNFWIEYTTYEELMSAQSEERDAIPSEKTETINIKESTDEMLNFAMQIGIKGPEPVRIMMDYINQLQENKTR